MLVGTYSPHGVFDFAEPVGALEDFAGFGAVGGANDAVALHQVDEVGGASVSDAWGLCPMPESRVFTAAPPQKPSGHARGFDLR